MNPRIRHSICRSVVVLVVATVGFAGAAGSAGAAGFFERLFGGFRRHVSPPPPPAGPFGSPFVPFGTDRRGDEAAAFGRGTLYCVRTCDGRYFPLQRHAGTTPAETCHSFCPTAKTMVFSGSRIDTAVAQNGKHYAELDNAFIYRDRVVENCSCNGKDRLGLARIDAASDRTLQPGDIVATNDGLATYSIDGKSKTAEYTPIDMSSSEWARRLAEVKVAPAPETDPVVTGEIKSPQRNHPAPAAR